MQHQHVRGCAGRHLMQQVAHGSSPDGAWVRGLAFECFSQDTQSWSGLEHSAPGQLSSMAMPQRRAACGAPDGPRWSRGRHRRGAGRGCRRTAETAARTMGTAGLASWQLHTYEKWPTHMKLLYILVPSGFFPTAPSVGCLADLQKGVVIALSRPLCLHYVIRTTHAHEGDVLGGIENSELRDQR